MMTYSLLYYVVFYQKWFMVFQHTLHGERGVTCIFQENVRFLVKIVQGKKAFQ